MASLLAAAVGAGILAAAGRRESDLLAVAGYYWLGVVLVEAFVFDVDSFSEGGWSAIAGAAGLLAGGYVHRLLSPAAGLRDVVFGVVATIAAIAAALGIADLVDGRVSGGLGLTAVALVYAALAAGVFRRAGFRDVATPLWALALVLVIGAE
ncbi:MAG: hypothetical protein H0U82_02960, partial [Actinobacteria bacterium]|nr:hypothetical protein [Actinomycetota bacterium]